MARFLITLVVLLLLPCVGVRAADAVENPKECRQCGMDRGAASARSRMVITYEDGTSTGVCSLLCAVEEIEQHKDKQVKSLQVADYQTEQLLDARTATWVVGGNKPGGMNSPAKWAFAKEDEARKFVQENGGQVTSFDQVMKAGTEEAVAGTATSHAHHQHMGPGSQMLFNPAFGDDIYHTHPAGMWMTSYKYMHMVQKGLRNGTTNVSVDNVTPVGNTPFGYMMAPTEMTMDMHMVMVMYGLTDRLTLMGMASYLENKMDMVMNMGMGNVPEAPMRTSGFGDTELRGIYQITKGVVASLGLSFPTGDTEQDFTTMGMNFRAPYDMQLGSGTYDLKPALTYNALSDDALWNWGAQAMYTWRTGKNNGYSLGDSVKVTGWLQRALGPAAAWLRLAYSDTGRIKGHDPEIAKLLDPVMGAPTPDADPNNYGGERLDGFVGASVAFGPVSLGVEGGMPLYQYVNGLQLKNDWYITAGVQAMF